VGIFAADIETTGLLEQMQKQANPKLHNFCAIDIDTPHTILFEGHQRRDLQEFLNQGHTLVMHNGKLFDMEALKLLGYDVSRVNLIDTLALSWYLEPNRMKHGLAEYGEEFGVPKPAIENWENQTQEEYNHRVTEDCKIQKKLWQRQVAKLNELYGTGPDAHKKIIAYLMQKMEEFRQQQQNRWKLDVEGAIALQAELEKAIEEKTEALRQVMPKVPEYVTRKRPSAPFKKNGEMSEAGKRWKEVTEQAGLPFEHKEDIKVVKEWSIGNPASHTQIKAWLDSLGWEPITFKFVRGENGEPDRNIPQINLKGGEICQSVKDLIPKCAGIEHIAGLGILNHRLGVVKGFLRDHIDGELTARMQGFTNTLRVQHREIVNLPSLRVKYGEQLRGLLMARPGMKLLGSDESSLEDRLKHHFQWKLDPEYVKSQMTKGFDPHNTIAVIAGLMTQADADWYSQYKALPKSEHTADGDRKFERIDAVRAVGKSTNYACQYGAGAATIARTAKVSMAVAKKLHAAYHKMNWSIAKIASMMVVKKTDFGDWQLNPINKMWYSLRSDKDRFSTLIQGTGAYTLDLWLYHCERLAKQRGLIWKLIGQMHDELIAEVPEGEEDSYRQLVADAMGKVNDQLKLNRELACDINFGDKYSDIH
jgi:DNA polymerase III epsilon subunit-like protein